MRYILFFSALWLQSCPQQEELSRSLNASAQTIKHLLYALGLSAVIVLIAVVAYKSSKAKNKSLPSEQHNPNKFEFTSVQGCLVMIAIVLGITGIFFIFFFSDPLNLFSTFF